MIWLEMNKKQELILVAIIVIAVLGFIVFYFDLFNAPEPEPAAPEPSIFDIVSSSMERQDSIDIGYLEVLESGRYTLHAPLVITNPYGVSPLTALVMFTTEEPVKISVHITGITSDADVFHTFSSYETTHVIPICGLYRGIKNNVEIIAEPHDQNLGKPESSLLLIETSRLSGFEPRDSILKHIERNPKDFASSSNAEFYFTFKDISAFDINGDYRWYYDGFDTDYPALINDDGNLLIIVGSFKAGDALLLEVDLLGRIIGAEPIDETYEMVGYGVNQAQRRTIYN